MIPNEDFRFRDDLGKGEETVPIELLTGPFSGVIFRYLEVSIHEQKDGATVKFNYDILVNGLHTQEDLRSSEIFNRTLGLILNLMILETVENNEARTDDPEQPTGGREVSKESPSIS